MDYHAAYVNAVRAIVLQDSICFSPNHEPSTMTPEERIYVAEAELAIAKALKEEADKVAALKAQFDNDRDLAQATIDLIFSARVLRTGIVAPCSVREESLARFRKELAPLAESYGVKIVLTGDKSTATVVLA